LRRENPVFRRRDFFQGRPIHGISSPTLEPEAFIETQTLPGQGRYQFDEIDKKYRWVS
jgi:hypothetical protein